MEKITAQEIHAAADTLQREAKRLEGLTVAGRVMRELGNLENRIAERERALAVLRNDEAAAKAEIERVRAEAAQLGIDAGAEVAAAKRQAEAHRTEAEAAAKKIHADAVANAARIVTEANEEAERLIANGCNARDESMAVAQKHMREAEEAARLVAERRSELDELNAKLAVAREQAAMIIGKVPA